jgi:ribosomal-protein-alanine N-acetyltransferase
MVTLRRLAARHLHAILTIQQLSPEAAVWEGEEWQVFVSPEDATPGEKLCAGYCAWVAETERGRTVGVLAGLFSGEEIEILNLAVPPEKRREGVASQLLDGALTAARNSGAERAFLEVRASNAGAIAFYERNGFLQSGRRKNYYSAPREDALLLSRGLSAGH